MVWKFTFYHIRRPPLNVTIFITHVRNCVMGASPMEKAKQNNSNMTSRRCKVNCEPEAQWLSIGWSTWDRGSLVRVSLETLCSLSKTLFTSAYSNGAAQEASRQETVDWDVNSNKQNLYNLVAMGY